MGFPVFLACPRFSNVTEFHQPFPLKRTKTKNQTNQTKTKTWGREYARVFLKNSNKSYSKTPRNPSWASMTFYLLQLKVRESALSPPLHPAQPPSPGSHKWKEMWMFAMKITFIAFLLFPSFIMNSRTEDIFGFRGPGEKAMALCGLFCVCLLTSLLVPRAVGRGGRRRWFVL